MASFLFSSLFSTPYGEQSGGGTIDAVPHEVEVALGGHPYMIDWKAEIPLRHQSIPLLRQQQDTSEIPGEQSLNPEGLWRRVGESWHVGAGQQKFDRKDSDPHRFRSSKGFDIWSNKWKLTLLDDVDRKRTATADTNRYLAVAGSFLYTSEGQTLVRTADITPDNPTWTTITGGPAADIVSMCSNGYYTWVSYGASGIYRTNHTITTLASHVTGVAAGTIIDYVKNRIMAAAGPSVYDITSIAVGGSAALPAALFTHGNIDWKWVGFAQSQSHIFLAGYSGDKSLIYKTEIKADGTALDVPTVAGNLPDGEVVYTIYGYLGRFLAIGTSKGFRLAVVSADGGLTIGNLIETPQEVRCFEGQEEFIWFGHSTVPAFSTDDAVSSGLGRMSTSQFSNIDSLTPAYASDIFTQEYSGDVLAVVTFQNRLVFTISGGSIFAQETGNACAKGYLKTGMISYGIGDYKTALYLDIFMADNNGVYNSTVGATLTADNYISEDLGSYPTTSPLPTFLLNEQIGREYEFMITLASEGENVANGILSWLVRVQPRPPITNLIFATVLISPRQESLQDVVLDYNTDTELEFIESLNEDKPIVVWQENTNTYSVILEDFEINFHSLINDTDGTQGANTSCTLKLKRV